MLFDLRKHNHKIINTIWNNQGRSQINVFYLMIFCYTITLPIIAEQQIKLKSLKCSVLHETKQLLTITKMYITVILIIFIISIAAIVILVIIIVIAILKTTFIITIGIIIAFIIIYIVIVEDIIFTFQKQSLGGAPKYICLKSAQNQQQERKIASS